VEKSGTARQATDENTIQCMCFACWVTKERIQTHTHSKYLIPIAFPRLQLLHQHALTSCYT